MAFVIVNPVLMHRGRRLTPNVDSIAMGRNIIAKNQSYALIHYRNPAADSGVLITIACGG